MINMLELAANGSLINYLLAYLAGFMTFFASCLLPLVPTYLAYLSGVSLQDENAGKSRWKIFKLALLFVAGFITVFMILGLSFNSLAGSLIQYTSIIGKIGGVIFILLGLYLLDIFKLKIFAQERRFNLHKLFSGKPHLHAITTGVGFGLGWSPCIGPVLAVILFWAARAETAAVGTILLFMFGLGLGTPFLLIALGFEKLIPILKKYSKATKYITYLSGIIVLFFGILLLMEQVQQFSLFATKYLPFSANSF